MDDVRVKRVAARTKVKAALAALRALTRVLVEYDRLEDADIIGRVEIFPGETEADYGSDLLDIVGQATRDLSRSRVVEVVVIETDFATDTHSPTAGRGKEAHGQRRVQRN